MQNDLAAGLRDFLRRSGNLLPISIRYGEGYELSKLYEHVDKRGENRGTPHLAFTVDPGVWARVAPTLGVSTVPVRDGEVFLLAVGHEVTLPGGYEAYRFFGVRTGIWHVQPERGFVVVLTNGEPIVAKSVEGIRRKLVTALKSHVALLSKPNRASGIDAASTSTDVRPV